MSSQAADALTLHDRLSHLTFARACRLLGSAGADLIKQGGRFEIDAETQARLDADALRVDLAPVGPEVEIRLEPAARFGLALVCPSCTQACVHLGAVLSLVLEEKLALGLAAPPPERRPIGAIDDASLREQALAQRQERARRERMRVRSLDTRRPWVDYEVTSAGTGRRYRVALRGLGDAASFCTCPDFRTNRLGTCKHILRVEASVRRRFSRQQLGRRPRRQRLALHLDYAGERAALRLALPSKPLAPRVARIVEPLAGSPIEDVKDLLARLGELEKLGQPVHVYPDAEDWIQARLRSRHLARLAGRIRKDPAHHALRRKLLRSPLLPYQLDGIAFVVGAGRAILADDMGLGKTIQAIGVAELLAREAGIRRVLIVCPASLKAQWRSEIERFSNRAAHVVLGSARERSTQYTSAAFFCICNYEQVLRDQRTVAEAGFDLVVLDEAHRIKNWEAKTSRSIKRIRSPFALALTGTPIENRLDDLFSVVEFVDDRLLGPAHAFFNRYRTVSETGRVLGYRELATLREQLSPVMLRRTRKDVLAELPPRSTEIVRVQPTEAQREIHTSAMRTVIRITRKRYISEMDLLRLRQALGTCRMVADAESLVDRKASGGSPKLERLGELLEALLAEPERKLVVFSEWTRMLDLIEAQLEKLARPSKRPTTGPTTGAPAEFGWVRLQGSVPQTKRASLMRTFREDAACRVFLTSNAGSAGLNLQSADTVINVDLPWNPAVLEQRIGRVHRMGQQRPVQVYLIVTEDTLEESLLATLGAKQELAHAVLDPDSDVDAVDMQSSVEELRERLEVLTGEKPAVPAETGGTETAGADPGGAETGGAETESADPGGADAHERARRSDSARAAGGDRTRQAGGQLVLAAFDLLDSVLPEAKAPRESRDRVRGALASWVEPGEDGAPELRIQLPNEAALDALAGVLVKLIDGRAGAEEGGSSGSIS